MSNQPTSEQQWIDQEGILFSDRDECEFCLGYKGGVKGNENVINGVVVCDYCHALYMTIRDREKKLKEIEQLVTKSASLGNSSEPLAVNQAETIPLERL
jgi:hypothetical protein